MELTTEIATLEERVEQAETARERAQALIALSWELINVDVVRALELADEALELSASDDDDTVPNEGARLLALRNQAKCHSVMGEYDLAMPIAMELAGATSGELFDPELRCHALTVLGYCYFRLGDYPHSLEMQFEAAKLAEANGLDEQRVKCLDYIAFVYGRMGKTEQAIEYHKEAIKLGPDDKGWLAFAHNNLAVAYTEFGDIETALEHGHRSLEIGEEHGVTRVIPHVLDTIGVAYLEKGETDKALGYFENALAWSREHNVRAAEIDALQNLARAYNALEGHDDTALERLYEGLRLAEEMEAKPQLIVCHQVISDVLARKGDFESALRHHRLYAEILQEVYNEKADQTMRTLQVVHETETAKKEAELHRLKNIELQDALEKVKLLSGLLPICAWCKRVRDDKGYWEQIDQYIDRHSEAEFSHSICPECLENQYPKKVPEA